MVVEDGRVPEEGVQYDFSINREQNVEGTPEPELPTEDVITPDVEVPQEVPPVSEEIVDTPPTQELDNDTFILQTLSEKLGRQINSFDEIIPQTVELNPQLKAISEWAERTGRPIEDWVKFNKDYSTLSDIDKAEEILKLKYPTLTDKEIGLELSKYIEFEDDLEDDHTAKSLELKKLIAENGNILEQNRLKFNEPVEGYNQLTPQMQEQLDFAESLVQDYQKAVVDKQQYVERISESVTTMESYDIPLNDEFSIRYSLTPEDKKDLPNFISTMPHWYNEDGSTNHRAVAEDGFKIKNFEAIVKMAYEQGKASGLEEGIKRDNNITLDRPTVDTEQGNSKGIVIEGGYKKPNVTVKFGKRS